MPRNTRLANKGSPNIFSVFLIEFDAKYFLFSIPTSSLTFFSVTHLSHPWYNLPRTYVKSGSSHTNQFLIQCQVQFSNSSQLAIVRIFTDQTPLKDRFLVLFRKLIYAFYVRFYVIYALMIRIVVFLPFSIHVEVILHRKTIIE